MELIIVSTLVIIAGLLAVFFWRPEREPTENTSASGNPPVSLLARENEQPVSRERNAPSANEADHQSVTQLARGGRDFRMPRKRGHRLEGRALSDEEFRKSREAAEKLQKQQLAQARADIDSKDEQARADIDSKDEQVRLYALGYLDPDNANDVSAMESVLLTDPSAEVREEAALQFGSVDKKIAEPTLIKALADPAPEVVVSAIEALASIDGANKKKIIAAIKQASASNANEFVQDAAQTALEEINR